MNVLTSKDIVRQRSLTLSAVLLNSCLFVFQVRVREHAQIPGQLSPDSTQQPNRQQHIRQSIMIIQDKQDRSNADIVRLV